MNTSKKNFALIGAAGYIAPRHLKAIKETGNQVIAAYDPNDSVGILDSFFPSASFYTEFERFDRKIEKVRRNGTGLDFVSICSPNYLHDAHIRFGLRNGANVICEKPLVLNFWNVDTLIQSEMEHNRKVFTILQLRLHPKLIELKNRIDSLPQDRKYDLELTYITSRGNWYYSSWKGDINKSGGIATNIGIHFFDMLIWLFGDVKNNVVHVHTHDRAAGLIEFANARVKWFLSINSDTLPFEIKEGGKTTFRLITLDGEPVEFSDGFTDLHTRSYEQILKGQGFSLQQAKPAVVLAHEIREKEVIGLKGDYHEFARLPLADHPFSIRSK
jgi:UDP-N-acetyl-2-amino-2-deoxyglucuronate dehydrogenase